MDCGSCRWGDPRDRGSIYCTVNMFVHQYNPPSTQCNCRDLAGSLTPRFEPRK
jgi:hypothetical protein